MRALLRTSLVGGLLAALGLVACSSSDEGSATETPGRPAKAGSGGSVVGTAGQSAAGMAGEASAGAGGEEPVPDGVGDDGEGTAGGSAEDEGGSSGSGGSGEGGTEAAGGSASGGAGGTNGAAGTTGAGGKDGAAGTTGAGGATGAGGKATGTAGAGGKTPSLPKCPCFSSSGYCGAAVLKEAEKRGCTASIPAGSGDDVLYCPKGEDGAFAVKETCKDGCVSAPSGQVDYCKATTTPATYKLPVACGTNAKCTNANNTNTHTGKDQFAYDFGMPVGTSIRAMRGGTVLAVRMPSPPGSSCYNGGGTSCANFANTVEIKHSDGTVGLYMHVSKILVTKGKVVKQGDEIAKSGQSGWVTGPHLHAQVQESCGIWWCQSKPFKFGEGSVGTGTVRESGNCQ